MFAQFRLGQLDTVTGAAGGVRYRPVLAPEDAYRTVKDLAQMLAAPGRVLPGGFIYMADILAMPRRSWSGWASSSPLSFTARSRISC